MHNTHLSGPLPAEWRPCALRILVVVDDDAVAGLLARGLARAGYPVGRVATGREALAVTPSPDVVLLDLGLPDMDGVELCRVMGRRPGVAVIGVTARGDAAGRVAALDEGADDCLVTPFGLAELLARVRAVVRRTRPPGAGLLVHGPLVVDPRGRTVRLHDRAIALTRKEFEILQCLAADPGRVVTRREILEQAWDPHWYGPGKVLDVHMAALRRKLGRAGLIETVYGCGFRLAPVESLA